MAAAGAGIHPLKKQVKDEKTKKGDNPWLSPFKVIEEGFEPSTHSLEGCCSIQLSYPTGHSFRMRDPKKALQR